jgi:hypothetical protein
MRTQDIFDHQVTTLVHLVQRLHKAAGADSELATRVRKFVAFELLGRGTADVIARAMGELGDAEADLLNDTVNHCSQVFYRTDVIWSAIAVPVALRWNIQLQCAYKTSGGDKVFLKELADGIRQCTGAQAVILDKNIYSANALYGASAHQLHDHLQQLVIGAPRLAMPMISMELRSANEAPWRMVYFLGVEVIDLKGKRRLHEPGVQDAMRSYLHLGADALTRQNCAMFKRGVRGETMCHSPMYMQDAIRYGQKALRGYRLRQMLEEMAKEEARVTLYYSFNALQYSLDLLLSGKWLAFEMRWKLFREEAMDAFLQDFEKVMSACAPDIECKLVCLEFEEFEAARSATAVDCYRMNKP